MQTKPTDILYCNVDEYKIKSAHPTFHEDKIKLLHYYINERYTIHLKKDVDKLPSPWTDDPILSRLRFTNVRREHDRCSKWLIDNISTNPDMSLEEKIYRSLFFRMYNTVDTAEVLNMNSSDSGWYIATMLLYTPDVKWFTNAYKTIGFTKACCKRYDLDYSTQRQFGPLFLIHDLKSDKLDVKLLECKSQIDVFNLLKSSILGVGTFLAYQFYVDLTYIPEFPFSENEYVVSGPGCNYGLSMITKDYDGLNDEELLFWLRDNINDLFHSLDLEWNPQELMRDLPEYDRYLNVMSLENIMCEFSKFNVRREYPHKHMRVYRERS